MEATRRFYTLAGTGGVLVCGAVLFARPFLLLGAAGVGAWLLAVQYRFVRSLSRLHDTLQIDFSVTPTHTVTDDPVTVRFSAATQPEILSETTVTATAEPPVTTTIQDDADRSVTLDSEQADAETAFTLTSSIAGRYTFAPTTIEATDSLGLFTETFSTGPSPAVTVAPRAPRNIHIGEGGEAIATAYGEHSAGRIGSGLEPAEIREYVVGDAARRIDWKATARLRTPHVREFEAETDRTTILLFDRRHTMSQGKTGETKLDYAREVALAFLDSAERLDDPLGLYSVGDEGLTTISPPRADTEQYTSLRQSLEAVSPTAPSDSAQTMAQSHSPTEAHVAATRLESDTSAFGRLLTPYLTARDAYAQRIDSDPLFTAARVQLSRLQGSTWTVIMTDDSRPAELRETAKLARRGDDHVLVFITPSVLFEPGGLSDMDVAYERYREFEEFRRDLAGLERVQAFEVAPGDRIGALLASRRREQRVSTQ